MARVQLTFDGESRGAVGAAKATSKAIHGVTTAANDAAVSESKLARSTQVATSQTRQHGRAADTTGKQIERMSRGALAGSGIFRGFGRSIAFASAGFLGGAGLTAAIAGAFGELEDKLAVAAQTNAVLKSTGAVAGVTAKDINRLAQSQKQLSGVDDELIGRGLDWLLTFRQVRNEAGKGNDIFDQASRATLNLAVATAQLHGTEVDLASATTLIGKALNDPIRGLTALQRVGVQFDSQQRKQIKTFMDAGNIMGAQKIVLRELNLELGNSARSYGQTLPGAISRARENVKDLGADLLTGLTPAIKAGADRLSEWVTEQQKTGELQRKFQNVIAQTTPVVVGFVGAIKDVAPIVQQIVTEADHAANAVGGWKTVLEGLLALKVVAVLAAWRTSLIALIGTAGAGGAAGAAGGTGLLGAAKAAALARGELLLLSKFAGLTIPIAIVMSYSQKFDSVTGDKGFNVLASQADEVVGDKFRIGSKWFKWDGKKAVATSAPTKKERAGGAGALGSLLSGTAAGKKTATEVTQYAKAHGPGSGTVYRWGGVSPQTGYDCSGYLWAAYKAAGITIPRDTRSQWNDPNAIHVPPGQEQPGDGVYFVGSLSGVNAGSPPGHVGIYIGNGQYIEYYSSGKPAKLSSLGGRSDYMGARRWMKVKDQSGGGTESPRQFTPHTTAPTKKKPAKTAITELPKALQLQIALAGSTAGLADDIAGDQLAVEYLTAKMRKTTDKGLKADLQNAINSFNAAIKSARDQIAAGRKKAAEARKEATARLAEERGIHADFTSGRDAAQQAFALDLLPTADEAKLKAQIAKFAALVRKAEKDGKITPAELSKIKASWSALSSGLADAARAVADNLKKIADQKWEGITSGISRTISEAWAITERDFGRETDKGTKAIQDKATADIDAMHRGFLTRMRDFGRETDRVVKETITGPADKAIEAMQRGFKARMDIFDEETKAGLKALEVLQTPTEKLLAERDAAKAAADATGRLAELTKARNDAAAAAAGAGRSRGAESIDTFNARVLKASKDLADAEQALADELYAEETTALQQKAADERTAADAKTAADQAAYQKSRDILAQALQDEEDLIEQSVRDRADAAELAYRDGRDALAQSLDDEETILEQAIQTKADVQAQAYIDERAAQAQALQDLHDDQTAAFLNDLEQWGTWLADKQRSYADFLNWLAANPISKGVGGVGADPWAPPPDALDRYLINHPAMAQGGEVPGTYVGVNDSVMVRATQGETMIDRTTTTALKRFLAGGGSYAGGGNVGPIYVLGTTENEVARALARIVGPEADRVISYRSQRA